MDRIFMILKIKWTTGVHLSLSWGYIHVYDHKFISRYLISQVSVYRTIGPLVSSFYRNVTAASGLYCLCPMNRKPFLYEFKWNCQPKLSVCVPT